MPRLVSLCLAQLLLGFVTIASVSSPAFAQFWRSSRDYVVTLNGENTVGTKMIVGLATAYAKQLKLGNARVQPGPDPDQYDVLAEDGDKMRVKVQTKGHANGLEALLRGQTDFWMAARQVNDADLEAMRKLGVPDVPTTAAFRQPGIENIIALSALTVIVHPKNPVPALSYQQLRDIYAGHITDWGFVGGPDNRRIAVFSPDSSAATADAFCALVMGNRDTPQCLDSFRRIAAPTVPLMDDLSDAVAAAPGGIGFIDSVAQRNARLVPLDTDCGVGIEPSPFRIKTEEYPITRKHYLYIMPGRAPSAAAKEFLQLTLGPVGQAVAAASGMANLTPELADQEYTRQRIENVRNAMDGDRTRVRIGDARAFEVAASGADRLTVTFRFQTGTNNLDSRAEADVVRLVDLMQQQKLSQQQVLLVGFSAAAGDYTDNRTLSKSRADAIRDRLIAGGIKNVTSIGVGPAGAVACNLDPNMSLLNQRVEVWLPRADTR